MSLFRLEFESTSSEVFALKVISEVGDIHRSAFLKDFKVEFLLLLDITDSVLVLLGHCHELIVEGFIFVSPGFLKSNLNKLNFPTFCSYGTLTVLKSSKSVWNFFIMSPVFFILSLRSFLNL